MSSFCFDWKSKTEQNPMIHVVRYDLRASYASEEAKTSDIYIWKKLKIVTLFHAFVLNLWKSPPQIFWGGLNGEKYRFVFIQMMFQTLG